MKSKTPPKGEVLRDTLPGFSRDLSTLSDLRSQHLVAAHRVRPALASIIASIAYGEAAHG